MESSHEFSRNLTNKTLSERSCWTSARAGLVLSSLEDLGYETYNYRMHKSDLLLSDIKEVDWTQWFELADNSDCEFGGVLMCGDGVRAHQYINPVIVLGSQKSVDLPGGSSANAKIITIHSHPSNAGDNPRDLLPSRADWLAGKGLGWQLVVTRWGIFAHFTEKMDCLEATGCKNFRVCTVNAPKDLADGDLNNVSYRLLFFSREMLGYDPTGTHATTAFD